MATRLETHKRAEYLGSKAVLVAIAIPVFTTQLERNHEATDLANIRSAYAETMTDFIADGAAIYGHVYFDSDFHVLLSTDQKAESQFGWVVRNSLLQRREGQFQNLSVQRTLGGHGQHHLRPVLLKSIALCGNPRLQHNRNN